jgi:hypothetical protein
MLAGERLTASVFIVGIVAAPLTTNANGTASSGTTETFDAVLGYYQATLISGHRYELRLNGLIGNASVASDVYTLQLRDSGTSSNPTSSSTLIAQSEWEAPASGSSGRNSIPLSMTFQAASSGVHTFGMSATRVLGTGVFTPLGTRELYVFDLGGN